MYGTAFFRTQARYMGEPISMSPHQKYPKDQDIFSKGKFSPTQWVISLSGKIYLKLTNIYEHCLHHDVVHEVELQRLYQTHVLMYPERKDI